MHSMLADFIVLMEPKLYVLDERTIESVRSIEIHAELGLEPPLHLEHQFESMMRAVGKLYRNDKMDLKPTR